MKKRVIFISIFIVLIVNTEIYGKQPDWFGKISAKSYQIIGYGMGETREEAIKKAKGEIANSIETRIQSESVFKKQLVNQTLSQEAKLFLKTETDVRLTDVTIIKEEPIKKTWYVAVLYELLPFEKKFSKKLKKSDPFFECKGERQNRYLTRTPLVKEINKELKCNLNLRIKRQNRMWYLNYGNVMQALTRDDFEDLFVGYDSDNITITSSNSMLTEGDVFNFKIEAKKNGYLTVLNVYENGEVFIISPNHPIKAGKAVTIPDEDSPYNLEAGLLIKGKPAQDLYISIISEKKLDLSRIQMAREEVDKGETHFKLHEVFDILNKYDFSATVVRTMPK